MLLEQALIIQTVVGVEVFSEADIIFNLSGEQDFVEPYHDKISTPTISATHDDNTEAGQKE